MSYKKRTKADQKNVEGGYKNVVYFTPTADIATFARPIANPVNPGDKVKITSAITFGAGNGWVALTCKKHSVTTTAETTGDDGSQSFTHKAVFEILGDDASTLESMRDMLNDDLVFLLKDQDCLNAVDYILLGDDCLPVDVKISFDGKTTKEGQKVYKLEISVKDKKFFYSGAVTEKPSTTSGAPVISNQPNDWTVGVSGPIALAVTVSGTGPFTYAWYKGGVVLGGQTTSQLMILSAASGDSGTYTVTITNASGSVTSNPVTVTVV